MLFYSKSNLVNFIKMTIFIVTIYMYNFIHIEYAKNYYTDLIDQFIHNLKCVMNYMNFSLMVRIQI